MGFTCPALAHVGRYLMYLIHFVVSLLSQLNISWTWLTNAPMPQPLSVFDCVVKAKSYENLSWKHHIDAIATKISKMLGLLQNYVIIFTNH